MPRFSANLTFLFNELPFLDRFEAASRAGFDAVEFTFPYAFAAEDVARAARAARVDVALFNSPPGDVGAGEFGLAALPGRSHDFRQSLDLALSYARILDCRRLHVIAGLVDPQSADAFDAFSSGLGQACDAAALAGVDILIEPLNRRSKPGYFLDDFGRAEQVIGEVARPNLKLMFDIFHRQILHGDVVHAARRLAPLIGHVQVASVPDRHEPDSGELADTRIFGLLDALGYAGLVGAEYHPAAGTLAGLSWFNPYRRR